MNHNSKIVLCVRALKASLIIIIIIIITVIES